MKKYFLICLFSLIFTISSGLLVFTPKVSSFPTDIYSVSGESVLLPDWEQISFSQFPPIASDGSFVVNNITRFWQHGQTPEQYLNLIDIQELAPQFTDLQYILDNVGFNLSDFSLDQFPLVGEQTLSQLVNIVPSLGNLSVSSVLPIADFVSSTCGGGLGGSIASAVSSCGNNFANTLLNTIDLSNFGLDSIPNLDLVPLGDFDNWTGQLISEIPGLSSLPLALFPNPIVAQGNLVARIDAVWGGVENERLRSVSGGYKVGFSVPCEGGNCGYVELDDLEREGRDVRGGFEGKSWIWGEQKVNGGSGCLSWGDEPTGRHPWGRIFKVVVEDIDQTTDMVETALYFRYCNICGCTAYRIGPVPFINYPVNSLIFLGKDESSSNFAKRPVETIS